MGQLPAGSTGTSSFRKFLRDKKLPFCSFALNQTKIRKGNSGDPHGGEHSQVSAVGTAEPSCAPPSSRPRGQSWRTWDFRAA